MKTERLILRPHTMDDLQDFYEYVSDAETLKFEPYKPMTLEEAKGCLEWRIKSGEFMAVELKSCHKMIGNVYLGKRDFDTIEIGYVFNRKFSKQGYATEACKALISDAFKNGTHRFYAECNPENPNSWKLLERLGFTREGYLKSNVYFWHDEAGNPLWQDTYIYSLLSK